MFGPFDGTNAAECWTGVDWRTIFTSLFLNLVRGYLFIEQRGPNFVFCFSAARDSATDNLTQHPVARG